MNRAVHIHKKAFIAMVNDRRKRTVVDTRYTFVKGENKLILVFEDGSQEIFKGLRAA